jgi:hypothetical protein
MISRQAFVLSRNITHQTPYPTIIVMVRITSNQNGDDAGRHSLTSLSPRIMGGMVEEGGERRVQKDGR